jgi:hypothetical protein
LRFEVRGKGIMDDGGWMMDVWMFEVELEVKGYRL